MGAAELHALSMKEICHSDTCRALTDWCTLDGHLFHFSDHLLISCTMHDFEYILYNIHWIRFVLKSFPWMWRAMSLLGWTSTCGLLISVGPILWYYDNALSGLWRPFVGFRFAIDDTAIVKASAREVADLHRLILYNRQMHYGIIWMHAYKIANTQLTEDIQQVF